MPDFELPQVTLLGSAGYDASSGIFTLTADAKTQTGAVMSDARIDLTQDFTISFDAFLGNNDAGGDGIAFVLHNDPRGADAIGGLGNAKGAIGIGKGLAISLDTYSNSGEPAADHTNFFDTDAPVGAPLTTPFSLPNLEDGQWHDATVSWNAATKTLTYWVDGVQGGTLTGDLASQYFGGSAYVHFGLTGATGGSKNLQQVKVTNLAATYAPLVSLPPGTDPILPQVTLLGSAGYDASSGIFTLTADAKTQTGAVMSDARIDLTQDFTISFDAFLGNNDAGGDGIAFVLHNDPRGADAIGGLGNAKGAIGIGKGLAISLDTYSNSGEPAADHTNFFDTDAPGGAPLTTPFSLPNLEDGQWHDATVSWNAATKTLTYWVDGVQGGTLTGDLASQYFGGSAYVHFGLTGATGGSKNLQQVKVTNLAATYAPLVSLPPGTDPILPQVTLLGSAGYDASSGIFTLTADAKTQTGAVMSDARIDLTQDFTISFDAFLGNNDAGGDGIAFVLHNDPRGADAIGGLGNAKGAIGIGKGLAISLDTYSNSGEPAADHTNFFDTDAPGGAPLTTPFSLPNLEDGQWHDATVSWNAATKTLTYWVDGVQGGTLTGDLASQYFGGSAYVHFGLTGATGGSKNLQQVKVTNLAATYAPLVSLPPGTDPILPQVTLLGSAGYDASSGIFTLTADAKTQTGAVMSDARIDLTQDFTISFDAFLGNNDAGGDGIAFVLHNDPRGADAIGGLGNAKGAIGIGKGLAISLDTYSNSGEPAADHTNFFDTDAPGGAPLTTPFSLPNLEDGQWHDATVSWNAATKTLTYWVDGVQGGTLTGDLASQYFGGSAYVHFGLTGATGGSKNLQQVKVTNLVATYAPPDAPPSIDDRGQWGDVFDWPIIGMHAILTPDGKLLTYGSDQLGKQGGFVYDVWDPATNLHYTLPNLTLTDIFCSACIIIPSTGQILMTGGDARPLGKVNTGVDDVNVFDYRDLSVSPSSDGSMHYERWYPTVVGLANGKVLVVDGIDFNGKGVGMPELYTPGEGWKVLTGAYGDGNAASRQDWYYPRAWLAPNGKVVLLDASDVMIMDPSGNGTLMKVADLPFTTSWQLPAVKFAPDKALILDDKGGAWIMDMSGEVPTFQQTGSLGEVRKWGTLVVLADGKVMVSGGSDVDNQLVGVHNEVQIWSPQTGLWTTGDYASVARMYHSTTILLPDATVLSLGGGAPGPLTNTDGEIYKPGYLFNEDGSLAERPVITDAPQSIEQRQDTFTVTVDDPANIARLTFVKSGAVTHSLDMSTTFLDLSFTTGPGNTLIVDVPENSNVLAPGHWMLFAFNGNGTPSVAAMVSVGLGGELFAPVFDSYVTLSGAASYDELSGVFTLTSDAKSQTGVVMSDARIDLTQDFTISFDAFLGNNDAGGDGIAFVLHNDRWGADAIGGLGNAKGAIGIGKGLAISLDTYSNPGEPAADHTNFFDTDAPGGAPLTTPFSLPNLEDGQWHDVTVSWNAATKTLTYWIDGEQGGTITGDLASQYFGGSAYVYFGFTGATGGAKNLQQVKVTNLAASYEPPDTPPVQTLYSELGADVLTGSLGTDHFAYGLPGHGDDIIKAFDVLQDRLSFAASGFGGGLVAGQHLEAGVSFIADANPMATHETGTFLYNTQTHDLVWDFDGSGSGEAVQIAHFETPVTLTINHFEITA